MKHCLDDEILIATAHRLGQPRPWTRMVFWPTTFFHLVPIFRTGQLPLILSKIGYKHTIPRFDPLHPTLT